MTLEVKAEWAQRCATQPGAEWRLLAKDGERRVELSNDGIFDQLVVDHWLHAEQMDERVWWLRVGDARLLVTIAQDGAVTLDVQRGFHDQIRGKTEVF
jgi:hypothetical protein